jgi:hypothetical protein
MDADAAEPRNTDHRSGKLRRPEPADDQVGWRSAQSTAEFLPGDTAPRLNSTFAESSRESPPAGSLDPTEYRDVNLEAVLEKKECREGQAEVRDSHAPSMTARLMAC